MNNNKLVIFSDTFKPIAIFLMMIVLMFTLFSIFEYDKGFLTTRNIRMLFTHMSISAITALGLTYVVAVGHFDMSFYMSVHRSTVCHEKLTRVHHTNTAENRYFRAL